MKVPVDLMNAILRDGRIREIEPQVERTSLFVNCEDGLLRSISTKLVDGQLHWIDSYPTHEELLDQPEYKYFL